ncbi:MAG: hypothetical protein KatS3mg104_3233 [Phycisphaerae bacterium]|nr:MAG: hypothetical protein KatS3mg104_3233 [Phycisphaerae bacterium]
MAMNVLKQRGVGRNERAHGQMIMQYGLVIMVVIVAVSAMSVFVQRALKVSCS